MGIWNITTRNALSDLIWIILREKACRYISEWGKDVIDITKKRVIDLQPLHEHLPDTLMGETTTLQRRKPTQCTLHRTH